MGVFLQFPEWLSTPLHTVQHIHPSAWSVTLPLPPLFFWQWYRGGRINKGSLRGALPAVPAGGSAGPAGASRRQAAARSARCCPVRWRTGERQQPSVPATAQRNFGPGGRCLQARTVTRSTCDSSVGSALFPTPGAAAGRGGGGLRCHQSRSSKRVLAGLRGRVPRSPSALFSPATGGSRPGTAARVLPPRTGVGQAPAPRRLRQRLL